MTWKQFYVDFARLYIRDGGRINDVAALFSVAPAMIYALLKSRGSKISKLKGLPPQGQRERRKIIQEFCQEKEREDALRSLLQSYGISMEDFLSQPLSKFPRFVQQASLQKQRSISGRNLEIAELRRKGATLRVIGQQYDITRERVRQIVLMYNRVSDNPVDIVKARSLGYRVASPERIERQRKAAELCRKGFTYRQIADALGVEKKYIFQDIARYNRTSDSPVRARREDNRKIKGKVREDIVNGRLNGVTNYVLAKRFGVSYGTICRVIKEAGLTRPRRTPKKTTKRVKAVKKSMKKSTKKRTANRTHP